MALASSKLNLPVAPRFPCPVALASSRFLLVLSMDHSVNSMKHKYLLSILLFVLYCPVLYSARPVHKKKKAAPAAAHKAASTSHAIASAHTRRGTKAVVATRGVARGRTVVARSAQTTQKGMGANLG